jgi:V/A-type H+/Na+-transporting ATPase subunit A
LPLSVELGPGLLGSTYDGIQRPLITLQQKSGDFIDRGLTAVALDRDKKWKFTPVRESRRQGCGRRHFGHGSGDGTPGTPGHGAAERLGHDSVDCRRGRIQRDGNDLHAGQRHAIADDAQLAGEESATVHEKKGSDELFLTGQRVLDCLFPISLGGSAIVPGGFGAGKTVVEQSLSKFCNADIIVYVGCGERGNEMADVLDEFPELDDPKTGGPLDGPHDSGREHVEHAGGRA